MTRSNAEILAELRNALTPVGIMLTEIKTFPLPTVCGGGAVLTIPVESVDDANITWPRVLELLDELSRGVRDDELPRSH
jgi:hypothetical protein